MDFNHILILGYQSFGSVYVDIKFVAKAFKVSFKDFAFLYFVK